MRILTKEQIEVIKSKLDVGGKDEREIAWSQEDMLEVSLKEPDDFL